MVQRLSSHPWLRQRPHRLGYRIMRARSRRPDAARPYGATEPLELGTNHLLGRGKCRLTYGVDRGLDRRAGAAIGAMVCLEPMTDSSNLTEASAPCGKEATHAVPESRA
jgi:hypothetical protein